MTFTEQESNENNLDKKNVISVENLCLELHEALSLGLERLRLMDELRIKGREISNPFFILVPLSIFHQLVDALFF